MYSDKPWFVNTTSHSKDFGQNLSPYFVGPIPLYDGAPCHFAKKMECVWQFCKVYEKFTIENEPTEEYFRWAKLGFLTDRPQRYPLGKNIKPLYSYWAGEKLGYIEARKRIYVPLFSEAISKLKEMDTLIDLFNTHGKLELWDFDCFDSEYSFEDAVNDDKYSMGHAFVIKKVLEERLNGMGTAL